MKDLSAAHVILDTSCQTTVHALTLMNVCKTMLIVLTNASTFQAPTNACKELKTFSENHFLKSFFVRCPFGQILFEDDHTCGFDDLCELNNGGCAHNCDFEENKIVCSCHRGYSLSADSHDCHDINECDDNNGGWEKTICYVLMIVVLKHLWNFLSCHHRCVNLEGSFLCDCKEGFELDRDKFTCIDVDECVENNGNCSNICLNLNGSKICKCESGYFLGPDSHTCHDINECKSNFLCFKLKLLRSSYLQYIEDEWGSTYKFHIENQNKSIKTFELPVPGEDMHDCSQICINTNGSYGKKVNEWIF